MINLAVIGVLGVAVVAALFAINEESVHRREQTWRVAPATILSTRPRLVGERDGMYGGFMLYQVEVFAAFDSGGMHHEVWATLDHNPGTLDEARFQMRHAQGAHVNVRWPQNDPSHIDVEFF